MADSSRAQNERTGLQAWKTTVSGSASQIPPDSWSGVPSRTPSQSETDTSSMLEVENDTEPPVFGPRRLTRLGLSENAHAYYSNSGSRQPEISVDYSFTEDCDLVIVIHSPHSPIVRYAVSKEVLSVSSRVLRPLIRELSEYRLGTVAGRRLGYLEMTGRIAGNLSRKGMLFGEHGAMVNRRLVIRGGVHLNASLWSQERLRKIEEQRQLRLSHLLWSLCELHSTLRYLCIEGRPNPNFRPENEICGFIICSCLAYGSLLRNINQAGWETGVSSISQMLQLWKGSVQDLEQKLGDVDFDTLESVDPGHRCSLEDIGSSFFNCITESDIAQQDNIRRTFGMSIARHRGPT
ncbi:hypothetical protein TWF106_000795 [Orbilia oligospora]|nr:hypothetical protein TWF679_004198 [Orbilia oligospora]KAF3226300.1 hypothetical protein TWF106_000795 [Orbilia oligospora]